MSLFIILSKFGVSACFCIIYVGTQFVFPAECVVFGFGTCAAIGHIASIFSPAVAELEPSSIAKCAFIGTVTVSMASILFLDVKK